MRVLEVELAESGMVIFGAGYEDGGYWIVMIGFSKK